MENGVVTAHIQIQYAGDAQDFGWLLPLPSIPDAGARRRRAVRRAHRPHPAQVPARRQKYDGNCGFSRHERRRYARPRRAAATAPAPTARQRRQPAGDPGTRSAPTTTRCSRPTASTTCWSGWPTTTTSCRPAPTQTVGAYIHPGAYFLALKLRPATVRPAICSRWWCTTRSDLPMIPIVLTSVAAQPQHGHPGLDARQRPRDPAQLLPHGHQRRGHRLANTRAQNYNDVIIAAVGEAPEQPHVRDRVRGRRRRS